MPFADFRELSSSTTAGDTSETIRARVVEASRIRQERFRKYARSSTVNKARKGSM